MHPPPLCYAEAAARPKPPPEAPAPEAPAAKKSEPAYDDKTAKASWVANTGIEILFSAPLQSSPAWLPASANALPLSRPLFSPAPLDILNVSVLPLAKQTRFFAQIMRTLV